MNIKANKMFPLSPYYHTLGRKIGGSPASSKAARSN